MASLQQQARDFQPAPLSSLANMRQVLAGDISKSIPTLTAAITPHTAVHPESLLYAALLSCDVRHPRRCSCLPSSRQPLCLGRNAKAGTRPSSRERKGQGHSHRPWAAADAVPLFCPDSDDSSHLALTWKTSSLAEKGLSVCVCVCLSMLFSWVRRPEQAVALRRWTSWM